ncbi:MAG: phage holin family protein [Janthinobacterium lividum]
MLLLRWLLSAFTLYLTVLAANILDLHYPALNLRFFVAPGLAGIEGLLVAVLALGIANAVLRPILKALTLPLTCLTFGLFAFVINAGLFWLAGQVLPTKFHIAGWQGALFGSLVMGIVGGILNNVLISKRERERRR